METTCFLGFILALIAALPRCCCLQGVAAEDKTATNRTNGKSQYPIPAEVRLLRDLTDRYPAIRPLARPVIHPADAVEVSFKIKLIQILNFDEENQVIELMLWRYYQWQDELLTWDPEDYEGIIEVLMPAENVWAPDIVLHSHIGSRDVEQRADVSLVLNYNGSIVWTTSAVYTSSCRADMTHFPYDEQTCALKFGSWGYSLEKVNLVFSGQEEIDLTYYVPSSEWSILDNTATRNLQKYECCPDRFVDIEYTLRLKRQSGFHVKMLLLPTLLLSCLVLVIFWIPPQRPDRTSLGMSLFSSFVLLLLVILGSSPPTVATQLGTYCCSSIALVTLATVFSALIVNLATIRGPMPSFARKIFVQYLGPKLHACQAPPASPGGQDSERPLNNCGAPAASPALQHAQSDWHTLAIVFDRIFFLIYVIVMAMTISFIFPWPQF